MFSLMAISAAMWPCMPPTSCVAFVTFDGTLYGLDVRDGAILWTSRLRAGSHACPSLGGGLLLVGAGVPQPGGVLELVAYGAR